MNVRLSAAALAQLDRIAAYLMARDPKAARRAVGAIRSRIGKLEGFPLTGRRTKVKGVRVVVELKHGYVITYRVSGEEVLVLDLRHGRRKRFRPKR